MLRSTQGFIVAAPQYASRVFRSLAVQVFDDFRMLFGSQLESILGHFFILSVFWSQQMLSYIATMFLDGL